MYFLLNMGIFHCYVCLPEGSDSEWFWAKSTTPSHDALLRSFLRPPIGSSTLPLGSVELSRGRSKALLWFWCYTSRNLTKHKTRHPVESYHPKTRDGDDVHFLFGDSCSRFPLLMTNSGLMSNRRDFTSGSFCVFFLQHWKLKKNFLESLLYKKPKKAHPVRFASTWSGRKGAQNHSLHQARRFFRGSLHGWQSMCAAVQAPKVPRISRQFIATVHRRLVTPKGSLGYGNPTQKWPKHSG